jgi:hypothetical protein
MVKKAQTPTRKGKEVVEEKEEQEQEGVFGRVPFWLLGALGALAGSLFGLYLKYVLQNRMIEAAMRRLKEEGEF